LGTAGLVVATGCNFHEVKAGDRVDPTGEGSGHGGTGRPAYARLASELFGKNCVGCHGAGRSAAGVDLSSRDAIASGNAAGRRLVVSGRPDDSLVVSVIESGRMPPGGGTIDPVLIQGLRCWIERGAPEDGAADCFPSEDGAGGDADDGSSGGGTTPPPSGPRPQPPHERPHPGGDDGAHDDSQGDDDDGGMDDVGALDDGVGGDAGGGAGDGGGTAPGDGSGGTTIAFPAVAEQVLVPICGGCHSGAHAAEGVDVTSYAALIAATAVAGPGATGARTPVIVVGDHAASPLWQAVANDRMPMFDAPLSDDEKNLLAAWIDGGAKP
jgi:hypothetical protein